MAAETSYKLFKTLILTSPAVYEKFVGVVRFQVQLGLCVIVDPRLAHRLQPRHPHHDKETSNSGT